VRGLLLALFVISLAFLTTRSAHAIGEFHELYRGGRAQAMANAFTAVADDEQAIFYNPAGLAGIPRLRFNYFVEDVEVSTDSILKMSDNISAFKDFTPEKLNVLMGQNLYIRSQFTPSFVMPNFGFAVIVDDQFAINLKNQAMPQMLLGYQMTNGFQAATGFSLLGTQRRAKDDLRLGFAGKMLWRRGGYHLLSLAEILSLDQSLLGEQAGDYERGMGIDMGLQYLRTLNDRLTLSFGSNFQNIGDITFGPKGDSLKGNLSAGVAATYKHKLLKAILSYEYRHLLDDADWRKKMHLGTEIGLPIVSLYGGLNQTHLVYGVSADVWYVKATVLSYAEDLATYAGQDASRRYMLRLQLKFGF
jgi:hypothetical protein